MVRRILAIFEKCTDVRPDAVFLVRDLDRQPQIRSGFEQVRNGYTWSFPVLFAFPDPEIEAWEVIGCEPDGRDGKRCLQKLKKQLSFDPCKQPHRLTSRPNDAPTDAKRVQKKLTNNDRNQIKEGLLRYLRKADKKSRPGEACGLDAFLEEVRSHLIPVFKEYSPKIV